MVIVVVLVGGGECRLTVWVLVSRAGAGADGGGSGGGCRVLPLIEGSPQPPSASKILH